MLPVAAVTFVSAQPFAVILAPNTLSSLRRGCDTKDHRVLTDNTRTAWVHVHLAVLGILGGEEDGAGLAIDLLRR